jgi:hypothetical protein
LGKEESPLGLQRVEKIQTAMKKKAKSQMRDAFRERGDRMNLMGS